MKISEVLKDQDMKFNGTAVDEIKESDLEAKKFYLLTNEGAMPWNAHNFVWGPFSTSRAANDYLKSLKKTDPDSHNLFDDVRYPAVKGEELKGLLNKK